MSRILGTYHTFRPAFDFDDKVEGIVDFPSAGERELVLNMPLYSGMKSLYIGLSKHASLEKCTAYKNPVPVVYYGSSITQGGCASRPGNCYPAMLSRAFDCDYINLGFSGSARGEQKKGCSISI